MYNPSRGGVRGGADQFTWESVKTDKHRENYLGHSLKAPVGRWQKGKDLSWYAKERKEGEDTKQTERSELAAIKRAEEEAMLIALGHNVVRKDSQSLTKEEMTEALKRNIGDRDQLNIERIDGVGVKSGRAALLSGTNRDSRSKKEGVSFETYKEKNTTDENTREQSPSSKRSKAKKSKKHKKEKKKRSHNKSESDDSEDESTARKRQRSEKTRDRHDASNSDVSENELIYRQKHKKEKVKRKQNDGDSYDSESSLSSKRYATEKLSKRGHNVMDSTESNGKNVSRRKHKMHKRDSDSDDDSSSRTKHKKKSKYRHQTSCNSDNNGHKIRSEKNSTREHDIHPKRRRHDTSESD